MSDGMSDARAESRIYTNLINKMWELRRLLMPESCWHSPDRWPHSVIVEINQIISDTGYWLVLAEYAEPVQTHHDHAKQNYESIRQAAISLKEALEECTSGHRGWGIEPDPTCDGVLAGTGYHLKRKA